MNIQFQGPQRIAVHNNLTTTLATGGPPSATTIGNAIPIGATATIAGTTATSGATATISSTSCASSGYSGTSENYTST